MVRPGAETLFFTEAGTGKERFCGVLVNHMLRRRADTAVAPSPVDHEQSPAWFEYAFDFSNKRGTMLYLKKRVREDNRIERLFA